MIRALLNKISLILTMGEPEIQHEDERITVFKWKLSNFSTVAAQDDPDKRLYSDDFQLDSSDIKCCLEFEPTNRHKDGDKNYSSFYLGVKDFADRSSIKLRFNLWIENELGEKIRETEDNEAVFKNKPGKNGWGYGQFIHHDKLYSANNQFVKNDVVFLCARIVYEVPLSTEFNRKIWASYKEGFSGECTLKVSGKELKVSKMVLAAHSEVFKKMLTSSMKEETTVVIEIYDFNVKTINALIEYLHKDSVDNLSEVAFELFKVAHKYGIKGLEAQCVKSLVKSLDKENLRDCIILAFQHNSEDLKTGVFDFIENSKDRVFISMIGSSEWIKFGAQNEKLASEIVETVSEKLKIQY